MARPTKQKNELSSQLGQFISEIITDNKSEKNIVDIITFCNDPKFLNFLGQDPPVFLWPLQTISLKLLYRGSKGNEKIELTNNEIKILEKIAAEEDLDYDRTQGGFLQVIDKYKRGALFDHLLLVMGRRSSKTMMVSIIAT